MSGELYKLSAYPFEASTTDERDVLMLLHRPSNTNIFLDNYVTPAGEVSPTSYTIDTTQTNTPSPQASCQSELDRRSFEQMMDDLLANFDARSPSPSNRPNERPSCSRHPSQDSEHDPELDRLIDLIQHQNQNQNSASSSRSDYNQVNTTERDNRAQEMDHSADLQVKTEPFQAMAIQHEFLHPGYATPMGFMSLNSSIPCDFMPQHSLVPPQGMFAQQGFLYPQAPPFPTPDSRRGSQGTASSTSQGGSPNTILHGPNSPAFAQHILRFGGVFNHQHQQAHAQSLMSNEEDADKLCAVCSDRAVCLHYGARTCEGCKGFFKRTVQKKSKYVCAGSRNCPIDKRYRSRCQFCRYQKCLAVGMVKEIVRHGSLSGRRGRLSSKSKTSRNDEQPSPPLPLLGLIVRAHDQCKPAINSPSHFASLTEHQVIALLEGDMRFILTFLHTLPQTAELVDHDINLLRHRAFFPIMALRHCNRSRDGDIIFETGERVPVAGIPEPFQRFFRAISAEAYTFQKLIDWDPQSYCALQAMQYLAGNTPESNPLGLSDRGSIDRVQSTIVNALKDHCAAAPNNKLAKIVQQIDKFDTFHALGVEMLDHCVALQYPIPAGMMLLCQMQHATQHAAQHAAPLATQHATQHATHTLHSGDSATQQPLNFSSFQQ